MVKKLSAEQETSLQPLGREDPLEKGTAIYPSTVAWRTPWIEESGGLQSMRFQRVGHDGPTNTEEDVGRDGGAARPPSTDAPLWLQRQSVREPALHFSKTSHGSQSSRRTK